MKTSRWISVTETERGCSCPRAEVSFCWRDPQTLTGTFWSPQREYDRGPGSLSAHTRCSFSAWLLSFPYIFFSFLISVLKYFVVLTTENDFILCFLYRACNSVIIVMLCHYLLIEIVLCCEMFNEKMCTFGFLCLFGYLKTYKLYSQLDIRQQVKKILQILCNWHIINQHVQFRDLYYVIKHRIEKKNFLIILNVLLLFIIRF